MGNAVNQAGNAGNAGNDKNAANGGRNAGNQGGNIVLIFWYETNLNTDFYFCKYYLILINWNENMLNIHVSLVGIKENNVVSTNPFVVDAMLPIMAKHANIWTSELVSIQAFHHCPEKCWKLKQLLLLKIIFSFTITQFPLRTSKFWQVIIQNFTLRSKPIKKESGVFATLLTWLTHFRSNTLFVHG